MSRNFYPGSSGATLALVGCLPWLILVVFNMTIGGLATEYVVEFWAGWIQHRVVDIPFWVAAVAGLFTGEIMIPLAIVTWLLSFVL